jgi:hypothetical protein
MMGVEHSHQIPPTKRPGAQRRSGSSWVFIRRMMLIADGAGPKTSAGESRPWTCRRSTTVPPSAATRPRQARTLRTCAAEAPEKPGGVVQAQPRMAGQASFDSGLRSYSASAVAGFPKDAPLAEQRDELTSQRFQRHVRSGDGISR